jgi:hypothetical protein
MALIVNDLSSAQATEDVAKKVLLSGLVRSLIGHPIRQSQGRWMRDLESHGRAHFLVAPLQMNWLLPLRLSLRQVPC